MKRKKSIWEIRREARLMRLRIIGFAAILIIALIVAIQSEHEQRKVQWIARNEMVRDAIEKEKKLQDAIQAGELRPPQVVKIFVSALKEDDFTQLNMLNKELWKQEPVPARAFGMTEWKPWKPSKSSGKGDIYHVDNEDDLIPFLTYRLARCHELITWRNASTERLARRKLSELSQKCRHLFVLGEESVFDSKDGGEEDGVARHRLPVTYTDLARMLCLFENEKEELELKLIKNLQADPQYCGVQDRINELDEWKMQNLTAAQYQAYREAWQWCCEAKKSAKDDQYKLALALHDRLCREVRYDRRLLEADQENLVVYAMLGKRATSAGYARAYMLLLTMAGIENEYIVGSYWFDDGSYQFGENKIEHAWNKVKLGEQWVHIDVAADDYISAEVMFPEEDQKKVKSLDPIIFSHCYFAMTDEQIRATHSLPDSVSSPEATWKDGYYFRHQPFPYVSEEKRVKLIVTSSEELEELIRAQAIAGASFGEYFMGEMKKNDAEDIRKKVIDSLEKNSLKGKKGEVSVSISDADINGVLSVLLQYNNS